MLALLFSLPLTGHVYPGLSGREAMYQDTNLILFLQSATLYSVIFAPYKYFF